MRSYDPSTVLGYDLTKPIGFPGTGIDGVAGGDPPFTLQPQTPPATGNPGDLLRSYDPSKVMGYDLTKPIGFPGTGIDGAGAGDKPFTLAQPAPPVMQPSLDNDDHPPFEMRQDWPTPLDGGFPKFRPPTGKVVKYETDNVAIQVEGSPFAYDPRDPWAKNGALDYLQNAKNEKGEWVGTATNMTGEKDDKGNDLGPKGQPLYNGFGNYVAQTGWSKPGSHGWHQSDYVNGDYVPTVSLTATQAAGMKKGDAVWLINETTGLSTLAIYADNRADDDQIEISTAAATNLGVNYGRPNTDSKGKPVGPTTPVSRDHIVMYVLPGSRVPRWFPGK